MGFNLTDESEQALPILQGSSEKLSLQSILHAREEGLPVTDKAKGDAVIRSSQRPPSLISNVVASLFDEYVDEQGSYQDGVGNFHRTEDGFHFHPAQEEVADIFEVPRVVGGIALSASDSEYASRRFQED